MSSTGTPDPVRPDRTSGAAFAGCLAVFYALLSLVDATAPLGAHGRVRGLIALIAAAGLAALWQHLRRRRHTSPLQSALMAAIPIAAGVADLDVTGDVRESPMLLLVLVATGAGLASRRMAIVLSALGSVGWFAVLANDDLSKGQLVQQGFQVLLATTLGLLLHAAWRTRERRLVAVQQALSDSERHYRGILDTSPVGVALLDEAGVIQSANASLCFLLGRPVEELIGSTALPFTHPEDQVVHASYVERVDTADDGVMRIEKRYLRPDGEVRWGWLSATRVSGPQGQLWSLAHIQDITHRKASEQELRDSESNLAAVARVTRGIRTGEDARSGIVAAARELAEASGAVLIELEDATLTVTAALGLDMVGASLSLYAPSLNAYVARTAVPLFVPDPANHPLVSKQWLNMSHAASALCHPLIVRGKVIGVLTVTWDHPVSGMRDRLARAVGLLADEAALALEHENLLRDLQQHALTDALTGLPNRRAWDTSLANMIASARVTGRPVTVAIADLDHFKAYNDTHGHAAGDDLLHAFATFGSSAMRGGDLLARWGGEEFAMALPDCDAVTALAALERLRSVVPHSQTCSIGTATWDGYEDGADLLKRADAALYEAKAGGRNRVVSAIPRSRSGRDSSAPSRRRSDQSQHLPSEV